MSASPAQARGRGAQLRTPRLLLRRWREGDLDSLAAINADPAVMEHFPATLTRAETAVLVARIEDCFQANGFGLWALEQHDDGALVGFTGLLPVEPRMPFAPAVEIGWRLAHARWGRGLAAEAARAVCTDAFTRLRLDALVSYTAARNRRSRRLMERLGMRRDPAEDFLHPALAADHALAPHVLYRLDAPGGERGRAAAPGAGTG